jgi:prepilin-type N-terminal cleavage/methylation domain-containing protein
MANKRQSGFTLIEIIITMAISAGLAVIALLGFSAMRSQTQFSDAVERLREATVQRRTEANAAVQLANGEDTTQIAFGRIMTFMPNSSLVQVQTLVTSSSESPLPGQSVTLKNDNSLTYTIAWGVIFNKGVGDNPARERQVAFIRSPVDGSLHTAISPPGGWSPGFVYSDFITGTVPAGVSLQVGDGTRTATIDIDPATNGVGRTF